MSVLERIFSTKAIEVAEAKAKRPLSELKRFVADSAPPRGFLKGLETANGLALIAEIKKASPSKGLIRPDFDPVSIAITYEKAGAHALSVLTDETYFQGHPVFLAEAHNATILPCLRKDFINDPYQVYQARAWGADAVLLIVAALGESQIEDLQGLIQGLGMDALVEVHTRDECEVALQLKCPLIGVNNRDLATFKTSLETSQELLPLISQSGAFGVSESALETRKDLDSVERAGARAVLIGTTFCMSADIEAKVLEVMNW